MPQTVGSGIRKDVATALGAALLFGASTPLAKALLGDIPPLLLAGLLYLGSGVGLCAVRLVRDLGWRGAGLTRGEWPWLAAAIALGGVLGPVLLMFGLLRTAATATSLLLNLEAVLTAVIAWTLFREHTQGRVVLGMILIVAGAVVLSWPSGAPSTIGLAGPLLIAAACLCWALDNNLTRKVSANDALFLACAKGLAAGGINTGLALMLGARLPAMPALAGALAVGLLGYGISLALFVLALRGLGTARTGAYFSTAPFIGAALAAVLLHEALTPSLWMAAVLMAAGVWLHLTERHGHRHVHAPLTHTHRHHHDIHHQHDHPGGWDGREPHTHEHQHSPLVHAHPHAPDIHHRHDHD